MTCWREDDIMIPQNAVTKLRVLARKSVFGFGKHHDKTVAEVLIRDKTYIAFAYYRLDAVSFAEDILDEMDLIRIEKPGTSEETFRAWRRAQKENYTEEERRRGWMIHKRIEKSVARNKAARVEKSVNFTKRQLQAINHGKM